MSDNFSNQMENDIINHFFMNATLTPATQLYVALFTASAGLETNLPTGEEAGGAYARVLSTFTTATAGTSENGADITFATATGDWGTVSHVAIVDHATNVTWGTNVNVLMWGTLTATKAVGTGDIFKIPAGDLDITVQ
jgi:hypothetical protein